MDLPPTPILPLTSLAVLPLLTFTMIFLTPDTIGMQFNINQTSQIFLVSYPTAFLAATAIGFLGFSQHPHWIDLLVGVVFYCCQFSFRLAVRLDSYLPFSSTVS